MAAYKVIYSRSPFYVQRDSTDDIVNLELRIWDGTLTDKPAQPDYELTRQVYGSVATFEISAFIRDYYTQTAQGIDKALFVEVVLYDGNGNDTETYISLDGYLLYDQGLQSQNTIIDTEFIGLPMTSTNIYRAQRPENGSAKIYLKSNDGEAGTRRITYHYDDATTSVEDILAGDGSADSFIHEITIPSNCVRLQIQLGLTEHNVYVDEQRCGKYDVVELRYINKHGVHNSLFFNMKSRETITSNGISYARSLVNYTSMSVDETAHAVQKMVLGGSQKYVLNSDFVDEYYNQQFEELLFSEYVWIKTGSSYKPVMIETNTIEKKKHVNDQLISYQMDVVSASPYLNSISF